MTQEWRASDPSTPKTSTRDYTSFSDVAGATRKQGTVTARIQALNNAATANAPSQQVLNLRLSTQQWRPSNPSTSNTFTRDHSPFSDVAGATRKQGTVAARIQALNNAFTANTPSQQSLKLRPSIARLGSAASSASREEHTRSGFGRRNTASFAAPAERASRNEKQLHKAMADAVARTPNPHAQVPMLLAGVGGGLRFERGMQGLVPVGAKSRVQVDAASPWAYLVNKESKPATTNVGEMVKPDQNVVARITALKKPAEPVAEQKQRTKSIEEELDEITEMIDQALKDHRRSVDAGDFEVGFSESDLGSRGNNDKVRVEEKKWTDWSEAKAVRALNRSDCETPAHHIGSSEQSSPSQIHRKPPKHRYRSRQKQRHCSLTGDTILPRSSSDTELCYDRCASSRSRSSSSSRSHHSKAATAANNSGGAHKSPKPHRDGSQMRTQPVKLESSYELPDLDVDQSPAVAYKARHHYHYYHHSHGRIGVHKHEHKHLQKASKHASLEDNQKHEPTERSSSRSSNIKSESQAAIDPATLIDRTMSSPVAQTPKKWRWWRLALVDKQSPGGAITQQAEQKSSQHTLTNCGYDGDEIPTKGTDETAVISAPTLPPSAEDVSAFSKHSAGRCASSSPLSSTSPSPLTSPSTLPSPSSSSGHSRYPAQSKGAADIVDEGDLTRRAPASDTSSEQGEVHLRGLKIVVRFDGEDNLMVTAQFSPKRKTLHL